MSQNREVAWVHLFHELSLFFLEVKQEPCLLHETMDTGGVVDTMIYARMKEPIQCPPIDLALITYISTMFPDCAPSSGTPFHQVWMDAGSAKVVRHLRMHFDQQHESMLVPQ